MSEKIEIDLAGIRARAEAAGASGWFASYGSFGRYELRLERPHGARVAEQFSEAHVNHAAGMDPPTTLALVDEVERMGRELSDVRRNRDAMAKGEAIALEMMAGERARADEADRCHEATGRRLGDTIDKMLTRAEAAEAEVAKLRARVAELEANGGE